MTGTENIFKALGDRNRLRILAALLCHKELCACQIHEWLGVTGATASKHLGPIGRQWPNRKPQRRALGTLSDKPK